MQATLERVHHPKTHRLDAKRIAELFGITGAQVARAVGVDPDNLRRRPDSPGAQTQLARLVHVWDSLSDIMRDVDIPRWLHHPNRDLGGRRPIELLDEGISSFEEYVQAISEGQFT